MIIQVQVLLVKIHIYVIHVIHQQISHQHKVEYVAVQENYMILMSLKLVK